MAKSKLREGSSSMINKKESHHKKVDRLTKSNLSEHKKRVNIKASSWRGTAAWMLL